jgi:hypothetical protein
MQTPDLFMTKAGMILQAFIRSDLFDTRGADIMRSRRVTRPGYATCQRDEN